MRLDRKQFNNFRLGRIDARREVSKQQRIRNNLERAVFPKINTAFRQFVNAASNEYSILEEINTAQLEKDLNSKLEVIMQIQYEKIFRTIFSNNEELYYLNAKADDVFVFGRSVDFERLVQEYTRSRVPYFTGMTTQLAKELETVIFNGRADGLNLDQISRSITKKGFPISRRRANLIARTETHNAASFANHDYHKKVQQDLGTELKKQWVSTSDLRTRSAHSSANGQSVSMDEDFIVGGARMSYAGDPKGGARNVINCRCIIIYAEQEAVIEDSQIEKDDYGDVSPEELEFHKNADWNDGESPIRNTIRKTGPVSIERSQAGGAYFRNRTKTINMPKKYGSVDTPKNKVVFRHEYGHAIDADIDLSKIISNADFVDLDDIAVINANRQLSTLATSQILTDRTLLSKINRANKKKWGKEVGEFGIKDSYYKKFGFKKSLDDDRWRVDKKVLVKNIRKELKNTDGLFNTQLLDDLLGKNWADDLTAIIYPDSNTFYINHVLNTVSQIKYNYSMRGTESFIIDLARIAKRSKKNTAYNEILNFSDFVGSVTNNIVFDGHPSSYYKKFPSLVTGVTQAHGSEAFANYFSLLGGKNSVFWRRLLEQYTPETMKKFDEIVLFINSNTTP